MVYTTISYFLLIFFDLILSLLEDFVLEIKKLISKKENITFFSGYDCDSLALENITGFASYILPIFKEYSNCILELRTKSNQIKPLDKIEPIKNCVIAFSLMPDKISLALDKKAPPIKRRIATIKTIEQRKNCGNCKT